MKLLAKKLINLRENLDLSKRQVADKLGISESSYGKYELDKRNPDIEMLATLAEFYDVPLCTLICDNTDILNATTLFVEQFTNMSKQEQKLYRSHLNELYTSLNYLFNKQTSISDKSISYPTGYKSIIGFTDVENARNFLNSAGVIFTAALDGSEMSDDEIIALANEAYKKGGGFNGETKKA